jgi:hypothetical protein
VSADTHSYWPFMSASGHTVPAFQQIALVGWSFTPGIPGASSQYWLYIGSSTFAGSKYA